MIELSKLYKINRKQLLRNLTDTLKSATKSVKKGKKKCPEFFHT